jgi:hypothetical protein
VSVATISLLGQQPATFQPDQILSQDVLTVADDRIRATQALETYVGGRRVFAK